MGVLGRGEMRSWNAAWRGRQTGGGGWRTGVHVVPIYLGEQWIPETGVLLHPSPLEKLTKADSPTHRLSLDALVRRFRMATFALDEKQRIHWQNPLARWPARTCMISCCFSGPTSTQSVWT